MTNAAAAITQNKHKDFIMNVLAFGSSNSRNSINQKLARYSAAQINFSRRSKRLFDDQKDKTDEIKLIL